VEKAAEHVRRWVQHSGDALGRTGAYKRHEGSIAREGRGIRRIAVEMRVGVGVWGNSHAHSIHERQAKNRRRSPNHSHRSPETP
jgi:hypothetical protein